MKKFAKIVQSDSRGQIVIPKDVRRELNIDEGSGYYMYIIEGEGLFLKVIPSKELSDHDSAVSQLKKHSKKLGISPKRVDSSIKKYKRKRRGNIEDV